MICVDSICGGSTKSYSIAFAAAQFWQTGKPKKCVNNVNLFYIYVTLAGMDGTTFAL